jgi:phenylacetate-CoA ligase
MNRPDLPLTDAERHPLLTDAGTRMLLRLREHPHAPRYNFRCGDRLTEAGLEHLHAYEHLLATETAPAIGIQPAWLPEFLAQCRADVPYYREREGAELAFEALPTTCAADLRREPWSFVPDGAVLDELVVYNTSGTSAPPTDVPSHPEAAALYLPLLRAILSARGVSLTGGEDQVAVAVVAYRKRTLTYASVSAYLEQAGVLKLNLHPADWRDPDDRVAFLNDCAPQVYTGDPVAFAELAALPLSSRPQALISTAMALQPALRRELEARFECPVLDLYSVTEVGPVAVAEAEREDAHRLVQPRLYVELLDADGRAVGPGERGEITVTGGINPYLPLLRYRTGDFATYHPDNLALLRDLQGRAPVVFRAVDGHPISTVDAAAALRTFALPAFTLRQAADRSLVLETAPSSATPQGLEAALRSLFGATAALEVRAGTLDATVGKQPQYASEAS